MAAGDSTGTECLSERLGSGSGRRGPGGGAVAAPGTALHLPGGQGTGGSGSAPRHRQLRSSLSQGYKRTFCSETLRFPLRLQVVAPAYILADVFWLLGDKHGRLAWIMALCQLLVKAASLVYAFQWLQATSGAWAILHATRRGGGAPPDGGVVRELSGPRAPPEQPLRLHSWAGCWCLGREEEGGREPANLGMSARPVSGSKAHSSPIPPPAGPQASQARQSTSRLAAGPTA